MKFLCLAYEEQQKLDNLTRDEWTVLRAETMEYVDSLRTAGQLVATHPLRSSNTAVSVRVRDGQLVTTDGPYAETKEQIGGYFLIDVPNIDIAIQVAAKWPSARIGIIEVRPIEDGLPEDSRYQ